MRIIRIGLVSCVPLAAQISNVQVTATSPTQAIITATKPNTGDCTIEISESATYSPLAHDVNPALFAGSNLSSRAGSLTHGREVTFVVGTRNVAAALDGRNYSRALQADTEHYFRIGCGPDIATGTFRTKTPPNGPTTGETLQPDPNRPGSHLHPVYSYTDRNQTVIDSKTGVQLKRVNIPGDQKRSTGVLNFAACEQGSGWLGVSGTCSALSSSDSGASSSYAGTAQQWLFLRLGPISSWTANLSEIPQPDWLRLRVTGYCAGADCPSAAARVLEACISFDAVTCASSIQEITVPDTTPATVDLCGAGGTATCTPGDFWGAPLRGRSFRQWGGGQLFNSGSSTTVTFTDPPDCAVIRTGDEIYVNGSTVSVTAMNCGNLTMTVSSALNLTPLSGFVGFPFNYIAGWGTNPRLGVLIRKKSATHAAATLHVQHASGELGRSDIGNGSSGGFHERGTLATSATGRYKYKSSDRAYSIHADTGEVRSLGVVGYLSGVPGIQTGLYCETSGGGSVLWDQADANVIYCTATDTTGKRVIVRGTYTGNDTIDRIPTEAQGFITAQFNWTIMTPNPNHLTALIAAFDASFDSTRYGSCTADALIQNQYLMVNCLRNGQDTYTWVTVLDLGNKLPLGSGGNAKIVAAQLIHKMPPTRWCVQHTTFMPFDAAAVSWQSSTAKDEKIGNNRFVVSLLNHWTGSAWVAGMPVAAKGSQTRIQVTSAWNGAWGAQPGEFSTGEPVSNFSDDRFLMKSAPGDYLLLVSGSNFEVVKIITKVSANELFVERGVGDDQSIYSPKAWTSGTTMSMRCGVAEGDNMNGHAGISWNFLASPNGSNAAAFLNMLLPGGGHQVVRNEYLVASPEPNVTIMPNGINSTYVSTLLGASAQFGLGRTANFARQQAPASGEFYESHPSFQPQNPRTGRQFVLDAFPFIGGDGFNFNNPQQATRISGSLFSYTYAEAGNNPDGLNRKHYATHASCGPAVMRDASGPGSLLGDTSADHYKYCIANAAGECRPGSAVGSMYFNCPVLRPSDRRCTQFVNSPDDVCIGDSLWSGMGAVQYEIPGTLNASTMGPLLRGRQIRLLTNLFNAYRAVPNTWNMKVLPNNKWGFYCVTAGAPRPDCYLVKIPSPATLDSVNRNSFVPVQVEIGSAPAGTANVVADFGYAEFGAAEGFFCGSRAEGCVASGASVNEAAPFSYGSEAFSGLECSSGCSLVIPGVSSRVLYYRVRYRNGAGAVIATGRTQAVVVP